MLLTYYYISHLILVDKSEHIIGKRPGSSDMSNLKNLSKLKRISTVNGQYAGNKGQNGLFRDRSPGEIHLLDAVCNARGLTRCCTSQRHQLFLNCLLTPKRRTLEIHDRSIVLCEKKNDEKRRRDSNEYKKMGGREITYVKFMHCSTTIGIKTSVVLLKECLSDF